MKHVLITEAVAQRKSAPIYLARGLQHKFHSLISAEEEEWDARMHKSKQPSTDEDRDRDRARGSFEEYREKSKAVGVM